MYVYYIVVDNIVLFAINLIFSYTADDIKEYTGDKKG